MSTYKASRGFSNLCNTCFLNVNVFILINYNKISRHLFDHKFPLFSTEFIDRMKNIVLHTYSDYEVKPIILNQADTFVNVINTAISIMYPNRQCIINGEYQDSGEIFSVLMDLLEIKDIFYFQMAVFNVLSENLYDYGIYYNSIQDLVKNKKDRLIFSQIHLTPILMAGDKSINDITDLIDNYFNELMYTNSLDETIQYNIKIIIQFPEILSLYVQRIMGNDRKPLPATTVFIPEIIYLANFHGSDFKIRYMVYAVVQFVNNNHYVVNIFKNNTWFYIDGNNVSIKRNVGNIFPNVTEIYYMMYTDISP